MKRKTRAGDSSAIPPQRTRGTIAQAFQKQREKEKSTAMNIKCVAEMPKIGISIQPQEMEGGFDNILKVFIGPADITKSSQGDDGPTDRTVFFDSVRALSLTTNGGVPRRYVYEKILKHIEENSSVTSTTSAIILLKQLEERFPAVSVSQVQGSNDQMAHTLQVNDQVWTPMNRHSEDMQVPQTRTSLRNGKQDVEPVDLANLAAVVGLVADDVDPVPRKDTSGSKQNRTSNRRATAKPQDKPDDDKECQALQKLGHSMMFSYLVGLIARDFRCRLTVFQERNEINDLKNSIFCRVLEALNKMERNVLWDDLLRIIKRTADRDEDIVMIENGREDKEKARDLATKFEEEGQRSTCEKQSQSSCRDSTGRAESSAQQGQATETSAKSSKTERSEDGEGSAGMVIDDEENKYGRGHRTMRNEEDVGEEEEEGGSQRTDTKSQGRGWANSEEGETDGVDQSDEPNCVDYCMAQSTFCELSQTLISIALELYAQMEKAKQYRFTSNDREELTDRLIRAWRSWKGLEQRRAFIETMEQPQQKLDFLLAIFRRYVPNAILEQMGLPRRPLGVPDMLRCVSTQSSINALKAASMDPDVLAIIVAHALEAHIALGLDCKVKQSQCNPSSPAELTLAQLVTKATDEIEKACGNSLYKPTKRALLAARTLAEVTG